MTHQPQPNDADSSFQRESWHDEVPPGAWNDLLDLLFDHGFSGMAQAMQLLLNEAMKLERSAVLCARPNERTPLRRGQANGFKPKTVATRLGPLAGRSWPSASQTPRQRIQSRGAKVYRRHAPGVTHTTDVLAVCRSQTIVGGPRGNTMSQFGRRCGAKSRNRVSTLAVVARFRDESAWREFRNF